MCCVFVFQLIRKLNLTTFCFVNYTNWFSDFVVAAMCLMIRSCWSRTRCYEFCLCYAASFIVQVFSIRPSLFGFFFFFVFFSLNLFFSLIHSRLNSNKAERLEFHLCIPYFNRACYVSYAHQHTLTRTVTYVARHMRKWYKWELHGHRVLGIPFCCYYCGRVLCVHRLCSYGLVT